MYIEGEVKYDFSLLHGLEVDKTDIFISLVDAVEQ